MLMYNSIWWSWLYTYNKIIIIFSVIGSFNVDPNIGIELNEMELYVHIYVIVLDIIILLVDRALYTNEFGDRKV